MLPRRLLVSLLALGTLACGGAEADRKTASGKPGAAEDGGTAVVAWTGDFERPFPLYFATTPDGDLQDVLFMGLTRASFADGRLTYQTGEHNPMALARSYEYAGGDSSRLRFHLRQGVRWSDGQPVTSRDVVFTFTAIRDPHYGSPRQGMMMAWDSVRAQDDSTVTFFFPRYNPQDLFITAHPLAPAHEYAQLPAAGLRNHPTLANPDSNRMVVSGPFYIDRRVHGSQFTLTRNPYFAPRPHLDHIVVRIIPDPAVAPAEFRQHNVDVLGVKIDQMIELRAKMKDVRFDHIGQRGFTYLAYNPRTVPAFADPAVRRALGMAVDVPALLRVLQLADAAQPAAGPYPAGYRDWFDPARMHPLSFDTAGARRLLAERGWKPGPDGVLAKDGKPLRFELLTVASDHRAGEVAVFVHEAWRRLGVDVQIRGLEGTAYTGMLMQRQFQAAFGGWSVQLDPDLGWFLDAKSANNVVSYDSPEFQRLADLARKAPTRDEANRLWRDAAVQVIQDQPYTFLYNGDAMVAYGPQLQGAHVSLISFFENPWEWWQPAQYRRTLGDAAPAPGPPAADSARPSAASPAAKK